MGYMTRGTMLLALLLSPLGTQQVAGQTALGEPTEVGDVDDPWKRHRSGEARLGLHQAWTTVRELVWARRTSEVSVLLRYTLDSRLSVGCTSYLMTSNSRWSSVPRMS